MRNGRPTKAALLVTLTLVLGGCWPAPGGGPNRRSANDVEDDLTAGNVATLGRAFEVDLPVGPQPSGPLADHVVPSPVPKAPIVTARGLFASSADHVHAFDRTTGEERWRTQVSSGGDGDPYRVGPPFLDTETGLLHVGTTYVAQPEEGFTLHDTNVVRIRAETGEQLPTGWGTAEMQALRGGLYAGIATSESGGKTRHTVIISGDRSPVFSPVDGTRPLLTFGADALYLATPGSIAAMAIDGSCRSPEAPCPPLWSTEVDGTVHPVVLDNDGTTLYATTTAGELHALDAATGELRWTADLGSPAVAPPAHAADDTLYVATGSGDVVAVSGAACAAAPGRCAPEWRGATGAQAGAMTVQPAVGGGVVYTGSADGSVHAFDATGCDDATCEPVWSDRAFDEPLDGGLAIAFGHLYAGRESGVVAYRPAG